MYEEVVVEDFPEMEKRFDYAAGVIGEFSSGQAARVAFTHAMQAHGYRLDANRTWIKPRFAAVMEP